MFNRRVLPLVVLAVFLFAATPSAYASTLKVTLNPATKVAGISSSSTTDLVITYPAGSALARFLGNYSSSVSKSGSFNSSSQGAAEFGGSLEEHDREVRVQSMNVTYSLTAKGNATTFVLHKQTVIAANVLGAFTVTNGTVRVDMAWKAFAVPGNLNLRLEGTDIDVNLVGSAFDNQLGNSPLALAAVAGMFGGYGLWHSSTLDFSSLNTPLSNWTRSYDSVTNTTTYSKTITGNSTVSVSENFNGQKYTLSMKSDPSAQVAVQGYAVASGDSLVIQQTPAVLNPLVWLAAGTVGLISIGAVLYVRRIKRAPPVHGIPSVPVR